MLIAVCPYKGDRNINSDGRLAVFDTKDCTVEFVSFNDIRTYNIDIKNIESYNSGYRIADFDLRSILSYNNGEETHYVGSFLCLDDGTKVQISTTEAELRINGKVIRDNFWCRLAYPFVWHDYVILRFATGFLHDGTRWHTVVCERGKRHYIADWSDDMKYATDVKLAMRIDMTSEV